MSKQSKTSRVVKFFSALFVAAMTLLCTLAIATIPPNYLQNRQHVIEQAAAFAEIGTFLEQNPEIEILAVTPSHEVEISVLRQGSVLEFSEKTMAMLVDLFSATKIEKVSRRENYVEFFAGNETKMWRYFQARVILKPSIRAAIDDGKVAECSMLFGFVGARGECLEVLRSDIAIHYLWNSDR